MIYDQGIIVPSSQYIDEFLTKRADAQMSLRGNEQTKWPAVTKNQSPHPHPDPHPDHMRKSNEVENPSRWC